MTVTVRTATTLDVARIRADFPILEQRVNGKRVVYLDNAATSQKPRQVLEAMQRVFEEHNANIHRGVYEFSERTTAAFEEARAKVARFINAPSEREVIFVRNATEGVNLVAYAWGRDNIRRGDRIVTTVLEHHSDFVPWQQLAKDVGAELVVVDIDEEGRLRRDQLSAELRRGAKLLAITQASNGLGTVNPVRAITAEAHAAGATVLIDAAQAVPHTPVDAQDLSRLEEIPGVTVYGPRTLEDRVGVVSFNIEGIHPHDVATILDREGVCVRAGHHCNHPLMTRLGVSATIRASMYLYNTVEELDRLVDAVHKAKKVFGV